MLHIFILKNLNSILNLFICIQKICFGIKNRCPCNWRHIMDSIIFVSIVRIIFRTLLFISSKTFIWFIPETGNPMIINVFFDRIHLSYKNFFLLRFNNYIKIKILPLYIEVIYTSNVGWSNRFGWCSDASVPTTGT